MITPAMLMCTFFDRKSCGAAHFSTVKCVQAVKLGYLIRVGGFLVNIITLSQVADTCAGLVY